MVHVPCAIVDVDECLEQNVHCGPNRMCFNMRGSYQCIQTPCPPDYQRDPVSGYVLPSLPGHAFENPSSSLSLTNNPCLQSCFTHRKSVAPQGIESYDVFLLQWTGKKWAHPAAATAAETITLSCRVSWSMSPQHVIHQATSIILPHQETFYRVIEPAFLWNCLISVGVASGFSGLSDVRALQEVSWLLWWWVNMTPWERGGEQRWVSGLSIYISSCLRILLSETLSFLGPE